MTAFPTAYPAKPVLDALRKEPAPRKLCLVEGMAGSGKSTFSRCLAKAWGPGALILSTDAFIRITRHEWAARLAEGNIDLCAWYDLEKIDQAVQQFFEGERMVLEGIYNLANGQHDLTVTHDTSTLELLIVEGLFAFDERFHLRASQKVFLEFDPEEARQLARQRDVVERNLSPAAFEMKERIYFDLYSPYREGFRAAADHVLNRE